MSTFNAQDFQAANKLTAYVVRYLNGQVTVKVSDGTSVAEASSASGEADAARKAVKALSAVDEPVVTDPEPVVTDPEPVVTDPEPVVTDPEPVVTEDQARDLHPAGADLLPPPPLFITGG